MGRHTTVLQVFVASPSDLKDERLALESVAKELNQTLSESTGGYLELLKWETHAVPGFGSDPQAVINEQIGDQYDIFIGMFSTKYGSATPRAGSGTVEEFERAYDRFKKNPDQLRIMFYFKDAEVKPSEIDLDQYRKVKEFKQKVGTEAVYASFTTTEEFIKLARLHLSRQLLDWTAKKWGSQITTVAGPNSASEPEQISLEDNEEEELGLLDLAEIGSERMDSATASLGRIEEAIADVGRKTEENTPKFTAAVQQRDIAKQKQVLIIVAGALEEFASRLESETPLLSNSYSAAIDAISKSATMLEADFKMDDKTQIQNTRDQLQQLLDGIVASRQSMLDMEETVSALPRLTGVFNKAKRRAAESLADLNRVLSSAYNLTVEALEELKRILDEHGTPVAHLVPVVAHTKKKRVAGLNRGAISTSEDFDEPLPDEFWLGQE